MDLPALSDLARLAVDTAQAAGEMLSSHFSDLTALTVETKTTPVDLVSRADTEAELLIRERLAEAGADYGFLGEEGTAEPLSRTSEYFWCVDPLDGTSNFLCGLPVWSVSIAFCQRDFTPLVGVIHSPPFGKTWEAVRGGGALCNGQTISVRPAPPGGGLANAMLATGFAYDVTERPDDISIFGAMQAHFQKIRRMGSAAIDLALVAEGTFDGMWEARLRAWDAAAGLLLIEEAGGVFSRYDGSEFRPGDDDMLVASTPQLHGEMMAILGRFPRR